jgi:hypothetical protein
MAKTLTPRAIKYVKARTLGKTKEASKVIAGYSPMTNTTDIEKGITNKSLSIKESLLSSISLKEITNAHVELIRQQEDNGVRLNAIKLSYDRIEPDADIGADVEVITVNMKG